jgi:branched-chain amino acid aminotransferase
MIMNSSEIELSGSPPDTHEVVWIDDGPADAATAGIHWSDHGLTVGDGVFETIKSVAGCPFALEEHLDRLERSAAGLALTLPTRSVLTAAVNDVARRFLEDNGPDTVARVRVTVTAGPGPAGSERGDTGPTLMVSASPMTLSREPTDVVVAPWTRNEGGALAGLKSISYAENVVALAHAHEQGASEAIFANTRGELCEGTGTNIFVEQGGILATPPLSSGCLDGITRSLLIDALRAADTEVAERALPLDALRGTTEAFLVSTGREVQPIARVDSASLRAAPGPLTREAMDAWDATFD